VRFDGRPIVDDGRDVEKTCFVDLNEAHELAAW
jgi:hypothetical protein